MKKTYIKPVITIIELPKNNFIATSPITDGPDIIDEEYNGDFD